MRNSVWVILTAWTVVASAVATTGLAEVVIFHVAPTGSDQADGTSAKPFATVERAQKAVRAKVAAGLTGEVRVLLHAGRYFLARPLTFGPAPTAFGPLTLNIKTEPHHRVHVAWQGHWHIKGHASAPTIEVCIPGFEPVISKPGESSVWLVKKDE